MRHFCTALEVSFISGGEINWPPLRSGIASTVNATVVGSIPSLKIESYFHFVNVTGKSALSAFNLNPMS